MHCTAAESNKCVVQVLSETPGATATTALYDVNDPNAGYVVKFILPVIVACLGLIEFFFTAGMLIYIYAQPSLEVTAAFCFSRFSANQANVLIILPRDACNAC